MLTIIMCEYNTLNQVVCSMTIRFKNNAIYNDCLVFISSAVREQNYLL